MSSKITAEHGQVDEWIEKLLSQLNGIRFALREIGTGDSSGPGALEFIGMQLRDSIAPALAASVSDIDANRVTDTDLRAHGEAIKSGLNAVADAIRYHADTTATGAVK